MKTIEFKDLKDYDSSKNKKAEMANGVFEVVAQGAGFDQWFSDGEASLFYTETSGDFLIETDVSIFRVDGSDNMPEAHFSSAGLLVKNPTYKKDNGEACWLMYNIGYQAGFWGREFKVTRANMDKKIINPFTTLPASFSTLKILPTERAEYTKLRLARIGNELRGYYQNANGQWIENDASGVTFTFGWGAEYPIENFNDNVVRPTNFGLEETVQVGIITNPGQNPVQENIMDTSPRDSGARFKYFSVGEITSFDEALK